MDKLSRKLPIQSAKVKAPIVLIANITQTHFAALGGSFYQPMVAAISGLRNLSKPVVFVPNVTSPLMTIEQRARLLSDKVARVAD